MGQSFAYAPPKLSDQSLNALRRDLINTAELMADEQILWVADALHETLRRRRQMRGRVHQRVEQRLGADATRHPPV